MNNIEQENENDEQIVLEEMEEDKRIDNSADLEQEKQRVFNAENNTAKVQIFVQSLGALNMNYKQSTEQNKRISQEKSYDLRKMEDCSEFVETYKNGEYLATAIILCTFEMVALTDVPSLQKNLMERLPVFEIQNAEGTQEQNRPKNPYISLNTILTVIGGKRFVRADGQICIGLGEGSEYALVHILEQFPILKEHIISWLVHMNEIFEYHTAFDTYQIATAFKRIISLDIADAQRRIFSFLYSDPDNVGLLGILAYKLYEDIDMREDMENMMLQWTQFQDSWLWKSACLAYSALMENGYSVSFESGLKRTISKRVLYFKKDDRMFMATLLIQSKQLRSMFANVFSDVFHRAEKREKRIRVAQVYINLVRSSYYLVNASAVKLPLVACDTKQQQECLAPIIEQVMSVYSLRKQLYAILKTYLKELAAYDFSENVLNHVCAYFYIMALSDEAYKQEILENLQEDNHRVSKQIFQKLLSVYEKGEL